MRASCGLLVGLLLAACDSSRSGGGSAFPGFDPGPAPADLRRGEIVYNSYCLSCHGRFGRGEGLGPPLLDSAYLRDRLPDEGLADAITQGARQRLWAFGAMPPVKRVTGSDLTQVVQYVRWLQRVATATH
jgi:mono/diheme cytochrome c family protein